VIYPGLVNTHHHLFQSVLKGVGAGIGLPLEGWVTEVLFRHWYRFDDRALEVAATIGIAELLLSGTTTIADHHFLFSDDDHGGAEIIFAVAERLGVRMVLCRGGATQAPAVSGAGLRGTPSERLDVMIARVADLAARHNDPGPDALRRVAFAPSTPLWSVQPDELRAIAATARSLGIGLHTHLSETSADVDYCRERFDERPVAWMARHDWLGSDVWFAHLVHVDDAELDLLAATGTGMAHCPQSNSRLGAGIAPAVRFAARGGRVSLAVDGAASNEAADMLDEMHCAWQIHRAQGGAGAIRAEDVVQWASAGGGAVLGLADTGTIAVGKSADLALFAVDGLRYAGLHDPLIGPVVGGGGGRVRSVLVRGRPVVIDGAIPGLDLAQLAADAAAVVQRLCA
jgi:cytosine/adenosine deaminase-related metal-dependent hydrolase